jgi:hypothetical protein
MISTELLEELRKLSHNDKLRVIQLLAQDLATEEPMLTANATYDVWSPFDAPQAAATLLKMLQVEQITD